MLAGPLIRAERPADSPAVHALLVAAFGGAAEADLVARLRADGDIALALVAELAGAPVGHVAFTWLEVGAGAPVRAAALAPLAVHPAHQRRGIGGALVRAGLAACRAQAVDLVLVLGDPAYYRRFGFTAEAARLVAAPWSGEAFMALALDAGAVMAPISVRYPDAFAPLD